MSMTAYPNGISSFGIPAVGRYQANGAKHYWVNGNVGGSDRLPGDNPDEPLATVEEAFTRITSGDVIHLLGNIREQLTAPAGVFDVTIVGEGTRPRHADAHTGTNGYRATCTWKSPAAPTAATPLLKLQQQGWRLQNILWVPPSDAAAIALIRDTGSGDDERDASHAEIIGNRFAGGSIGIQFLGTEILHNCLIADNVFQDSTYAIRATAAYCRRAIIERNHFELNTNHIVAALTDAHIIDNVFGQFTTLSISLAGGGGHNVVARNVLSGTYSEVGGYIKSNANDEWGGNYNSLAGGITASDPA
jgi:hypothetical protein